VAHTSNNAEDLGSMEFRDDVEARALGNQVIQDLIGTRAEHYYGWTLDIAEGERALPSIPFVPANWGGLLSPFHCAGFQALHDASENAPAFSGSEKPLVIARLAFDLRKLLIGLCLALGARKHLASPIWFESEWPNRRLLVCAILINLPTIL
jgi:hypothetical protein